MKRFFINLICCFVPCSVSRRRVRRFLNGKKPKNNIIEIVKADGRRVRVKRVPGCKFVFTGDNNHIVLHEPIGKLELIVHVSSGVYVELQPSVEWSRSILVSKAYGENEQNKVIIGRNLKTTSRVSFLLGHGGGDICIGEDCMFATGIVFRTGDFHTIFDVNTGRVLNFNQSISIGNHVWLGDGVWLLKGACVADNTIVGARSLVNKKFEKTNVIIAGTPAKIVKENVNWDVRAPHQYALENNLV